MSGVLPLFLRLLTMTTNGSLDILPEDVLVDDIFVYLTVEDILSLRQVSKRYWLLSHTPIIWKRFLQYVHYPVPPIPPTPRHSWGNIDLEAERLVIRGMSLDNNWRDADTQTFAIRSFQAYHEVLEMKLLPGGKYLVASIRGPEKNDYLLMVFLLDHHSGLSVPLAKIDTSTKAYSLQAKYMTFKGVHGIVIAYLRQDFRKESHRVEREPTVDPSEYKADPPHYLQSECICLHVSLERLEVLGDLKNHPESPEHYQDMVTRPSPFNEIYKTCSAARLDALTLTEVDGAPWATFVKRAGIFRKRPAAPTTAPTAHPEEIVFKDLDSGAKRTMRCRMWEVIGDDNNELSICNVRLIPCQKDVLIIRSTLKPLPNEQTLNYLLELYHIPTPGSFTPEGVAAWDRMVIERREIASFHLSECTDQSLHDSSVRPTIASTPRCPAPISVFYRTLRPACGLLHSIIWPTRVGAGFTFSLQNMAWQATTYTEDGTVMHVLPGVSRSLMYTVPRDDPSPTPALLQLKKYITRRNTRLLDNELVSDLEPEILEPHDVDNSVTRKPRRPIPLEKFGDIILPQKPQRVLFRNGVNSLAWDEGVGRACIAPAGDSTVYILDFAHTPIITLDQPGDAVVVPLPVATSPLSRRHDEADGERESMSQPPQETNLSLTTSKIGIREPVLSPIGSASPPRINLRPSNKRGAKLPPIAMRPVPRRKVTHS